MRLSSLKVELTCFGVGGGVLPLPPRSLVWSSWWQLKCGNMSHFNRLNRVNKLHLHLHNQDNQL